MGLTPLFFLTLFNTIYKYIELLEDDITIPDKRTAVISSKVGKKDIAVVKVINVKNWI